MSDTSRETVEALADRLETQLVMSLFLNRDSLYQEGEKQRDEAAETLRALLDERDHALALVAAAYEAAADRCRNTEGLMLLEAQYGFHLAGEISALTPADATAKLDAIIQKAVEAERERLAVNLNMSADARQRLGNMLEAKAFRDEAAAIREGKAYDKAAKSLHGEFATLNFPEEM